MSDFRTPGPKPPPPKHGIKLKKAGSTWWGARWITALESMSSSYESRLARGKTYARAGRTHDLVVKPGEVTAKVTGSRSAPYEVVIHLVTLSDDAWDRAVKIMSEQARFAAELLAGRMPEAIDEAFRAAGASLFPAEEADLTTRCSCPDWANPCKHVAAAHYVLGEAFDRDPFLLFELRGRIKSEVLDALRVARGGTATRADAVPVITLGALDASNYDRPREPLPELSLSFEERAAHGAAVRQLGAPATWTGARSPADVLAPLVKAAAEEARRIALAEPPADEDDTPPR